MALSYRHRAATHPASLGPGFPLDDAWIHAQFALNVSRFAPFQYNLGEFSSGSTAPLWSLLEGIFLSAFGDVVTVAQVLGVGFTLATVTVAVLLARRLGLEGVGLITVPLLLVAQWRLVWASLSGMEVPLASFLLLLSAHLYLLERTRPGPAWRSGLVAGLLFWTRPEGLVVGLVMALDQLLLMWKRREESQISALRPLFGLTLTWLAVILPLFALNAAFGPGIFPQTVYAKAHIVPWDMGWRLLGQFYLSLSTNHITWHLFFVAAVGFASVRLVIARKGESLLVVFALAYLSAIAFFRGSADHYERYLMPCIPVIVVLGTDGLSRAIKTIKLGQPGLVGAALALIATASPTAQEGSDLDGGGDVYALNVASVNGHVVAMGNWAKRHIPPEATLAMSDVGAMSFFTDNRVVDMRGLISPYFGWDRQAELDRQRSVGVDYALLFPELNERVILRGRYIPVHVITLDANNISATDNLVVYRTPWSDSRELRAVGRSFDFEDGTLQGWAATGSLSQGPVEGAGEGQRRVINLGGGRYFLSSWGEEGDRDQGGAISPEFQIEGELMTLRLGGGQLPGQVGVRLRVDGRIARTALGARSEVLVQREWDLRDLRGRNATLELFDETSEGWGHVMLDEIHQYLVVTGE